MTSLSREREREREVTFSKQRVFNVFEFADREELLLQDCEWKIRETERSCKDRINAAELAKKEALQKSEQIANNAKTQSEQVVEDNLLDIFH